MRKFKSITPGDLVNVGNRFWKVVGCYYGAVGQEDVIGIESLDRSYGDIGYGPRIKELLVPLELIPHEAIFRPVDHDEAAKPKLQAVS